MLKEKQFSHLLELSPKLSMLIIDKMEADDRCRFSGSSKLCNKKAKASKNYIHGLTFKSFGIHLFIHIINEASVDEDEPVDKGYMLRFEKDVDLDNQYIKCMNFRDDVLWITEIDSSEDLFECALEHFKGLLQMYQNSVKELKLYVKNATIQPSDIDFGITSLNNLRDLDVYDDTDIRQFLPKTKGLERLTVTEERNGKFLKGCEEIYQVTEELVAPLTSLNNEKFLRLSASEIFIHIGQLTEEDIFTFVNSWRNDSSGKKVKRYRWNLQDSNFDVGKMFGLFGVEYAENDEVEVKHNTEVGRGALLAYSPVRWLSKTIFFEEIN